VAVLAFAQLWQDVPGVELKEPLRLTTDLADLHLVETGIGVGADGVGMGAWVGAAWLGHLVLGYQLSELGEVARKRKQLRGFPGNGIGWPEPVHPLAGAGFFG
jgi:hypothetical protein